MNVNEVAQKARNNGFEDYKGGAGPSPEMAAKNLRALASAIEEAGDFASCVYLVLEVDGNANRTVTYDRWGFSTVISKELDQAGLAETAEYLMWRPPPTIYAGCRILCDGCSRGGTITAETGVPPDWQLINDEILCEQCVNK